MCGFGHRHGAAADPPAMRRRSSSRRGPVAAVVGAGAGAPGAGPSEQHGRRRPSRHHPVPLRRARPRRGGRAGRLSAGRGGRRSSRAQPLTVAVMGSRPGFAYLDGPARRRCARVPAARPAAPRGAGRLGGARQRPGRRLSDGVARAAGTWSGAPGSRCSRRTRPPYAVLAPGGPGAASPWPGAGEPVEPEPLARAAVVAAGRRPAPSSRSWRPGCAPSLQDGGRRGPWPRSASRPPVRPIPVSFALANRLVGNADGAGRAGAHRAAAPGCAASAPCHVAVVGAAPDVRVDGTAVPAGQVLPLDARPGARGRPSARGLPHLPGRGRRVPRSGVVRQQRHATS